MTLENQSLFAAQLQYENQTLTETSHIEYGGKPLHLLVRRLHQVRLQAFQPIWLALLSSNSPCCLLTSTVLLLLAIQTPIVRIWDLFFPIKAPLSHGISHVDIVATEKPSRCSPLRPACGPAPTCAAWPVDTQMTCQ